MVNSGMSCLGLTTNPDHSEAWTGFNRGMLRVLASGQARCVAVSTTERIGPFNWLRGGTPRLSGSGCTVPCGGMPKVDGRYLSIRSSVARLIIKHLAEGTQQEVGFVGRASASHSLHQRSSPGLVANLPNRRSRLASLVSRLVGRRRPFCQSPMGQGPRPTGVVSATHPV